MQYAQLTANYQCAKKWKDLPMISATVRPLVNLPLGSPLPKSIPYHGKLAWARLLERYLLFPTSDRESPKMNCTILQSHLSSPIPKIVATITTSARLNFMFLSNKWYFYKDLLKLYLCRQKWSEVASKWVCFYNS